MNVNLTPELEALVRGKVESGLFRSSSEVVRHALRVMLQSEEAHLDYLRRAIAEGIAQADRGELLDGPAVFERLRKKYELDRED